MATFLQKNFRSSLTTKKGDSNGSFFGPMETNDYEQVVFCHDKVSGLKSIIAIHNSTLGPTLGGVRMWPYKSEEEGL